MLKFNVKRMFAVRGIEKTTGFLVKLGMSYPRASRYLKLRTGTFKVRDVEKLCLALNCTPNELFEWQPDANTVLPEAHSLNALTRDSKAQNLQEMVKDVPADKLALIERFLNELKK